jgi:Amt family ammonium transporter
MGAIIIGLVGGAVGFFGVAKLKKLFNVDDSLDAFWVHGLVGIWGSIATAIFIADYAMPENYNLGSQLVSQIEAILLTIVYSGVMTAVVYFIASAITGGGRVDEETETIGLDEVTHGEKSINL